MLPKEDRDTIKKIIFSYINPKDYKISIYGSRAGEFSRKFSDIDIGIEGNRSISGIVLSQLKEEFENSTIPYRVDVADFSQVSHKFKQIALKNTISLN